MTLAIITCLFVLLLGIVIAVYFFRKQKRILLEAVYEAQETERQRIGREIHDCAGVAFLGISNKIAVLQSAFRSDEPMFKKMEEIQQLAMNTSNELRTIAHELIPETVILNGIIGSVEQLGQLLSNKNRKISVFAYGDWDTLPKSYSVPIYRIIQGLIQNVVKYSKAHVVSITLVRNKSYLMLTVEDNGVGFKPLEDMGGGLLSINERLKLISGKMYIESTSNYGSIVRINIRLKKKILNVKGIIKLAY